MTWIKCAVTCGSPLAWQCALVPKSCKCPLIRGKASSLRSQQRNWKWAWPTKYQEHKMGPAHLNLKAEKPKQHRQCCPYVLTEFSPWQHRGHCPWAGRKEVRSKPSSVPPCPQPSWAEGPSPVSPVPGSYWILSPPLFTRPCLVILTTTLWGR